jgi:hypothetical protein
MTDDARPWRSDVTALVLHPSEPRLLLQRDGVGQWRFPSFVVDEAISYTYPGFLPGRVRDELGIAAVLLRSLVHQIDRDAHRITAAHLLESPLEVDVRGDLQWGSAQEVGASGAGAGQILTAAVAALRDDEAGARPVTRRPWEERRWLTEAIAWVDARLRESGLTRTGPVEQVKHWALSSVVRVPTTAGNLYLKTAAFAGDQHGPGNAPAGTFLFANEAKLLKGLAARFPNDVPRLIAGDPDRVLLLMADVGAELGDNFDVRLGEEAVRRHARHQLAYAGQPDRLLAAGCLDRRLSRLAAQLDPLLADQAALALLKADEIARLRASAPRLRAMIVDLAALGMPESLVHGDLHPWNVGIVDGQPVVFDWTDGCIAHPYFDIVVFLGQIPKESYAPEVRERIRSTYLEEWRDVASRPRLERALAFAEVAGALHQAVSYQRMLPALEGPAKADMAGGAAHWLRRTLDRLDQAAQA